MEDILRFIAKCFFAILGGFVTLYLLISFIITATVFLYESQYYLE
jgi:hypothetical protein